MIQLLQKSSLKQLGRYTILNSNNTQSYTKSLNPVSSIAQIIERRALYAVQQIAFSTKDEIKQKIAENIIPENSKPKNTTEQPDVIKGIASPTQDPEFVPASLKEDMDDAKLLKT